MAINAKRDPRRGRREFLEHKGGIQAAAIAAAVLGWKFESEISQPRHLLEQVQRINIGLVAFRGKRRDFFPREGAGGALQGGLFFVQREIHQGLLREM